MNLQNSYDKLKKISEQINSIISEYDNINMQLMQQQMMMQQMQQQFQEQQQIMQPQINNKKFKYNAIFKTPSGKTDILAVDFDITVEELLNKYINEYYGPVKGRLVFLYNVSRIKRNEQRTVENFFKIVYNPQIIVNNYDK